MGIIATPILLRSTHIQVFPLEIHCLYLCLGLILIFLNAEFGFLHYFSRFLGIFGSSIVLFSYTEKVSLEHKPYVVVIGMITAVVGWGVYIKVKISYLRSKYKGETDDLLREHCFDKPFFILNLLATNVDPLPMDGVRANLENYDPDKVMGIVLPVRIFDDQNLQLCPSSERPNYFLVGFTFTGFDLVLCNFFASSIDAENGLEELHKKLIAIGQMLRAEGAMGQLDFYSLRVSGKILDVELSKDSKSYLAIQVFVRSRWLQGQSDIVESRSKGLMGQTIKYSG